MTGTMKAAVIRETGGPDAIKLEVRPIPTPRVGQVLFRVKVFGLDRSELFTRQCQSPDVPFPRTRGIEAVGCVEQAPNGEFEAGDVVAPAMGVMARAFNSGYAEYTMVPANQVQKIDVDLGWDVFGAAPETLQTAWGLLFMALQLRKGDILLFRGGTTSVGLAAAAIAKKSGPIVAATTRNPAREAILRDNRADRVCVDKGQIDEQVGEVFPRGVNYVLELVGTTTLADSLQARRQTSPSA